MKTQLCKIGNLFILLLLLFSCSSEKKYGACHLEETNQTLSFSIDTDTKNHPYHYSIYKDTNGTEYFTFQNSDENSILFYDLNTQKLAFKINPPKEGNNGVGRFYGYHIHTMDSIYLMDRYAHHIYIINRNCQIIDKIENNNQEEQKMFYYITNPFKSPIIINDILFVCSEPNRLLDFAPVTVAINIQTKEKKALPFAYPHYSGMDVKLKKYGLENDYSRCFDGKRFIYSFHYDENLYVATPTHDSIQKVPAKSKYIDKVQLPDELKATVEDFCVNAWYNNLLYDPYREVYYRITHPASTLDKEYNPMDIISFGRKNFSILILDKDFNLLGETLSPNYTYNPQIMFIRPEGLYISDSHCLNPQFNDDILSFRLWELVEE